ncbi:MAG TPA: SH3-like domain-containing protein [Geminicoccaceae bacterium]|nr:SH3-like domain-containing protein [Geminicoccaceae bacterium]
MSARFAEGAVVRVNALHPPGHYRTPFYTRGHRGTVLGVADRQPNPEELAYGRDGLPALPVYRVRFAQAELWPEYRGDNADAVVDLFEPWLEPADEGEVR